MRNISEEKTGKTHKGRELNIVLKSADKFSFKYLQLKMKNFQGLGVFVKNKIANR